MQLRELKDLIFECYAGYLSAKHMQYLTEDKDKEDNMVFGENAGETLPDATDIILAKFPTLKHCLVRLQTENFADFTSSIDWISPRPTEFRVNLKNGQYFTLKWMGKDFEATISGKRYYLGQLTDYQRALQKLGTLYQEGPMGTGEEEPAPMGPEPQDKGPVGGGGGGDFSGSEGPVGGPEPEAPTGPEGEAGEETQDLGDENINFEEPDNI